nr:hypothetical protein [Flavihumibacter fluvii]
MRLAEGLVGRIGVAAQDISSGLSVTVNGDEPFVNGKHLQSGHCSHHTTPGR